MNHSTPFTGPRILHLAALIAALPAAAHAQSYDLRFDWSSSHNPTGPWSYLAGSSLLPPIASWQSAGWTTPQPGWALVPAGSTGATPFWFKSNGTETFDHDWLAGDIVVHTRNPADGTGNGAGYTGAGGPGTGNGPPVASWISPLDGVVTFTLQAWAGQPAAHRHDLWLVQQRSIYVAFLEVAPNATRASPAFTQAVQRPVLHNDPIELRFDDPTSTVPGEFIGVSLNIIVCIGITQQPARATICPGGDAHLSVQARTSYGTLTYRWRKNAVPLLEGQAGRFHGVFGPTLTVAGVTAAEVASYDCVVGSTCLTLPSDAAGVSICAADFNCSGSLGVDDLFDFLNAWMSADPRSEFDGLPGLNMDDVVAFVDAWFTGC